MGHLPSPVFLLVLLIFADSGKTDPCRTNFGSCDRSNGLCWGTGRTTHFCSCKAGYRDAGIPNFHHCVDVNECLEDTACPDNAVCVNNVGSYTCTCKCGYVMDYTGQHCLAASRIDGLCTIPQWCTHLSDDNQPPVPFHTKHSESYVPDHTRLRRVRKKAATKKVRGECECEPGFEFNDCGYCVDKDECATGNPCRGLHSTCTNTEGSYYCGCNPGYVLGPCRIRCYLPTQNIPTICSAQDLESLQFEGVSSRSFARPITLDNWRTCAPGVETGATVENRFDTDKDKVIDLFLSWLCVRGTSTLKLASAEKAKWDNWSCWTACKATCWGGLQTRVRKCLNGLPGVRRCRGAGTQKRSCYHGAKCGYRIRKDAETLSATEKDDLVQAMRRYKNDKSVKGFFSAGAAHGWPFQCNKRSCCPHGAKMKFLAWHRTFMLHYEEGLSRYLNNKTLGIPYWNWLSATNRGPPDLAWDKTIRNRPNPFAGMTVRIDWSQGERRDIERDNRADIVRRKIWCITLNKIGTAKRTQLFKLGNYCLQSSLNIAESIWSEVARKLYRPHNMHEFSEALESAHNRPHVSVCRSGCRISLGSLSYASFDPLFMLHHAQVDRLWAVAQKNIDDAGNTTWTTQTALEALEPAGDFGERHMPFANKTINAFPIVQAVNTMRDAYYYTELTGVKYDDLNNDGYPPVGVRSPFRRAGGEERLFIAHYLQSVEENVYINYYINPSNLPCSRLTTRSHIGRTLIQGTTREYKNSIPRITVPDGINRLDREYVVTACYTSSPDCTSRCPGVVDARVASMPDPGLVYFVPNQPIDIYKFNWSSGRKFPTWYIDLHAKSQWVLFYGDRSSNMRQVRSSEKWSKCDTSKSRPVRCNNKACLLRSGIYYLVDSDKDRCMQGLKLLIIARR